MVFHIYSDHRMTFCRVFFFGFPLEARHSPGQGQMYWISCYLLYTVPASGTVVSAYFVARADYLFCLVHPVYLAYHSWCWKDEVKSREDCERLWEIVRDTKTGHQGGRLSFWCACCILFCCGEEKSEILERRRRAGTVCVFQRQLITTDFLKRAR